MITGKYYLSWVDGVNYDPDTFQSVPVVKLLRSLNKGMSLIEAKRILDELRRIANNFSRHLIPLDCEIVDPNHHVEVIQELKSRGISVEPRNSDEISATQSIISELKELAFRALENNDFALSRDILDVVQRNSRLS